MKKNIAMRVAALLFILTMISTCAFATTFAKYTTSESATDSARVAKWGVNVVVENYDVFNTDYDSTTNPTVSSVTVEGQTRKNVVAPGTNGNLTCISITGTPEVSVNVAFTAELELTGWTVDSTYYCPLEITVGKETYKGMDYTSTDDFETAVENAIKVYTKNYAANTDLSSISDDAPVVSWAWAFEGNDDVKDTKLGDAATAEISLTVTCTVTQED